MKTNAIVRIILFSLAILVLLGILLSFAGFDLYVHNGRVHSNVSAPTEAPMVGSSLSFPATVHNLEIEWVAGNVNIIPLVNLSQITVSETIPHGFEDVMVCKQSGQTLKVKFTEKDIKLSGIHINETLSKDLDIYVPADWMCDSLEIDAAAAEVYICDLTIDEFDFDGASGNLILENCTLDEMDIDTASGDVEFTGSLKNLDFDAASASFWGEFKQAPKQLKLNAMSGDLELVLPHDCGFTCEMDAMSGEFNSDFEIKTNNHHYIHGSGDCKIKISAMSGDVEILKGVDHS